MGYSLKNNNKMMINEITDHIKEEFSSSRFITTLTPDTFLRKIIIISTTLQTSTNLGETAVKQVEGLNHFNIEGLGEGEWKVVKQHKSLDSALRFHLEYIKEFKFTDCEESKGK